MINTKATLLFTYGRALKSSARNGQENFRYVQA